MKQTVDEERESSSPISPDEQQLLDRLHSKSVDEQVGAIVGIGKGAFRRLAGEIAPFIRDPNAELRAAAIRTVGFYWKLAEYRDVAAKMWRSDPDHETRSVAMMAWAGYDQNTKSAPTIRQLYQVVCDEYQPDLVRDAAYTGMISVFGVPAAERPRGAMSLNAPIEDGIDWTLVDRIVQESGAIVASEAAKAEVMEIVYGVGAEKDPINGRIVVKLGRDSSVELEHVHGKRRVWCGTLESGVWEQALAVMELDGFPAEPNPRHGLVPGTRFIEIAWRRRSEVETVSFPSGTMRYRDVSKLMFSIVGEISQDVLGFKPPDGPRLVAAAPAIDAPPRSSV